MTPKSGVRGCPCYRLKVMKDFVNQQGGSTAALLVWPRQPGPFALRQVALFKSFK